MPHLGSRTETFTADNFVWGDISQIEPVRFTQPGDFVFGHILGKSKVGDYDAWVMQSLYGGLMRFVGTAKLDAVLEYIPRDKFIRIELTEIEQMRNGNQLFHYRIGEFIRRTKQQTRQVTIPPQYM